MRLIDADALRETIIKGENISSLEYHLTKQYEYIENAPTVEQKIGHWKRIKMAHYTDCECSCCGYSSRCRSNYCPNCGAKMEG